MRFMPILPLALAGTLVLPAAAQTLIDVGTLRELDDAEVIGVDDSEIGEVEKVLVDATGRPVALVVEMDEGFLGIDHEKVIFSFDQLDWEDGNYRTALTRAEVEALPRWED